MSTIVIKVPTSTIKKMQQFYQRELLAKKVPYTVILRFQIQEMLNV